MSQVLTFPFSEAPEGGSCTEVVAGVFWLRMPLPIALDHINLYLIEDDDGWWVVDTGMNLEDTRQLWEKIFASALKDKPVKAVLVTHMHPDHIGLAGWLCDRWQAPLYTSFGEYFAARSFVATKADDFSWQTENYYRSTGLPDTFFVNMKKNFTGFSGIVAPLPGSYRRLEDGDSLTIGGSGWRVVMGSGHSPEHVCLYCEEKGVLISGDQLIAEISSNVSVMAVEPEADPLSRWLSSLEKLNELPDSTLVLPAHKLPFINPCARAQELQEHHAQHLQALLNHCEEPQSAVELLPVLFKRELQDNVMTMAVGECVAHLRYLCNQGKLIREAGEDGVDRYRAKPEFIVPMDESKLSKGDIHPV